MALPAVAGNVCTWKGGSGKFSDANWDVAPVSGNGDTLVFDTSNGTAITVENDLADDFAIRALKTCAGEGWASFGTITLTGRRLYFDATASRSDVTVVVCGTGHPNRGAPLTFNLPLRFKGGCMRFSNTVVFNEKISIDDKGFISLGWPEPRSTSNIKNVTFNCEIHGPNAKADIVPGNGGYGSRLEFNGPVTLQELYNNGAYLGGKPKTYFNATGNSIQTFVFKYNHQIYFPVANAFDDTLVIHDVSGQAEQGVINFGGDQVIDRFTDMDGILPVHACRYVGEKTSTVTMRARADTTVYNTFEGKLSLVWDPQGDYTFTLRDHLPSGTNTMSGRLEVKRGTVALRDGTCFTQLSNLTVRAGATFSLAQSTAEQPFPTTVTLAVDAGGKVEIPAGRTLRVGSLFVAGVPMLATSGYYTKDSCDWIAGGGVVDYRPIMTSQGTLAMNESLNEQVKCWTNMVLGISVPPRERDATNFDYRVVNTMRTPQGNGIYVYRGRSLTVDGGALSECSYRDVVTNQIENEGLFLKKGSITFNGGRFGQSTWTGKITVLSPQGTDFSLVGGNLELPLISQLFLSGQLIGMPDVGLRAGGTQSAGITGLLVVTNSFSQNAKVTVYHTGRMWHGRTPVLKLAAGCSGTLDASQFEFGGYMTQTRVPSADVAENWPRDLHLEVSVVKGEQILSLVSQTPGAVVIFR